MNPAIPSELVGAWRLEEASYEHSSGAPWATPCDGFLVYTESGIVSAHLRWDQASGDAARGPAAPDVQQLGYHGYVGTYGRVADPAGGIAHRIVFASTSRVNGTEQVRRVSVRGDRLTVEAEIEWQGATLRGRMIWQRIG